MDSLKNKFNLIDLRIKAEERSTGAVKKIIQKIPVRKPNSQEFLQVDVREEYSGMFGLLKIKEDGTFYLVDPALNGIVNDIKPHYLFLAINKQKQMFIWPVAVPNPDGRQNAWTQSALDAVTEAKKGWVKIVSNMQAQGYEVHAPVNQFSPAEWPETDFEELLNIAFRNNYIENEDHFVIKQLLGSI